MEKILDFEGETDVALFDRVVEALYGSGGSSSDRQNSQSVLSQFQSHPMAWTRADKILQMSTNPQSKYIALSILDNLIKSKWKALPDDQRLGIRNFIASMVISLCNDDDSFKSQRTLITKCDLTLVQIIKQDWPENWPNFVPELIQSSKAGFNVCENNMIILKLMSEEVFDYSTDQLTQARASRLKISMANEFQQIVQLCFEVLDKATRQSLIESTLKCLQKYIPYIPLGYIFETGLVQLLSSKLLPQQPFRSLSLKCLIEISQLISPQYDEKFIELFNLSMTSITNIIPPNMDLSSIYTNASSFDQEFLQDLALFLTTFLSNHLMALEGVNQLRDLLSVSHTYLISLSKINERELFKICLDYWQKLVFGLYQEIQNLPTQASDAFPDALMKLQYKGSALNPEIFKNLDLRKNIYNDILISLRIVIIENMVKPEEVLIVENDEGEIVREFVRESDTIQLYKSMREILVYLTHLDVLNTEQIMSDKLARQIDGSEWSWHNINTLCWAIGSISGSMDEEGEKKFLVLVIKDLLALTEMKKGKDNKAVVASNIMYIVGQYPRFLKAHWKFLKTVVNKLFEFMHETHEGVQDMACDTFIKIVEKCKRHFIIQQTGEQRPFIEDIIENIQFTTSDLQPQQVHTFYKSCAIIISSQNNKSQREPLLIQLMSLPNMAWSQVVQQAQADPQLLSNPELVKIIANIIKTNVAVCGPLGPYYSPELAIIYLDMLSLYKAVSGLISNAISQDGLIATKTPKVRGWRTIKKEILILLETYLNKSNNGEEIVNELVQPLLNAILEDYNTNVPDARDSEVLNCLSTLVHKVGELIPNEIVLILSSVFQCTLNMINKDFTEYPEHRVEFYKLLREINLKGFNALVQFPPNAFQSFIDAILWAFKHNNETVENSGLLLCDELLTNIEKLTSSGGTGKIEFQMGFYKHFYFPIISDVFYVLTDSDHKASFKNQSILLSHMLRLIVTNVINQPIYPNDAAPMGTSNEEFLKGYLGNMLMNAFPQLEKDQMINFLNVLFKSFNQQLKFQGVLRDFLVQIKQFGGDATDYLFADDLEQERLKKENDKRAIGGLLKPSELANDD